MPHGGTNLCFHAFFKDSLSSYSQHQAAIDHLVTIKLNALPLLKYGLFKIYPGFYNCDSLNLVECGRKSAEFNRSKMPTVWRSERIHITT